ncbi:MAG: type I phosphomannose isomerase catalytic subunit [Pirellulales bacterium]
MPVAYPLRCQPFFRDYLWGGRRLESRLGKQIPTAGTWAESWEFIDHPEHSSLIINGPFAGKTLGQVLGMDPCWLVGKENTSVPLLLKYLDCQKVLSVQVHPDDDYGLKMNPPDLGKTEAWYIVDSQPGSVLFAGLKPNVGRDELAAAIEAGTVDQVLHTIEPQPGDCVFIPAGTVHALGAGLLVAEIQQASNTTFRLFDWNRVGPDGKRRPVHVEQSLAVSDYQAGPRRVQIPTAKGDGRVNLVSCDKFVFDRLSHTRVCTIGGDQRFHFITTPTGGVRIEGESFSETLSVGESLLLPAALSVCEVHFEEDAELLDMYLPEEA